MNPILRKPIKIQVIFESNSWSKSSKLMNLNFQTPFHELMCHPSTNSSSLFKLHQILKIPINSIKFQTLKLPWISIQVLSWILKRSNKESCSLFNSLQICVLFEIVGAWEGYVLIESIQIPLKCFEQMENCIIRFGLGCTAWSGYHEPLPGRCVL
jgi:hypothetical protein